MYYYSYKGITTLTNILLLLQGYYYYYICITTLTNTTVTKVLLLYAVVLDLCPVGGLIGNLSRGWGT